MVVESEEANNTERLAIVPAVGEKTRNEKKERLGAEEERQAVGEERERERGVKRERNTTAGSGHSCVSIAFCPMRLFFFVFVLFVALLDRAE